jgi:secondary thiamine-phosphate synthase enzyme
MIGEVRIQTTTREEFINIDSQVTDYIKKSGKRDGRLTIFVPHTTAAVTINEKADPDVTGDIITKLGDLIPQRGRYRHREGNSDAHIKASLLGSTQSLFISNGKPLLGTWQSVFFCEFDGPRTRRMILRLD